MRYGYNGVKTAKVKAGDTVAIIGQGPVGLMAAESALAIHFALKSQLYLKALQTAFEQVQLLKQHQLQLATSPANQTPLLG